MYRDVEIVLDDGNVVCLDFDIEEVSRYAEKVTIHKIRSTKGDIIHYEDIKHVHNQLEQQIDEYLRTNKGYSRTHNRYDNNDRSYDYDN